MNRRLTLTRSPVRALAALLAGLLAAGCGGAGDPTVVPPDEPVRSLARSEREAQRLEQDLAALFAEPLARGELDRAIRSVSATGFAARAPRGGSTDPAGDLEIQWLEPGAEIIASPARFVAALHSLGPLAAQPERVEVEVDRFELDVSGERATGRIRLRWAGDAAPSAGSRSRVDVTIYAEVEARSEDGADWSLTRFEPATGSPDHPLGAGAVLRAGPPRFVDRTAEVGLTFGTSRENRELLQAFVDRHRTLTLGSLSIVDFDRDGRQDVIATRSNEATLLFRNDGTGGFVPVPLPMERFADHPAFVLFVDLDGDGLEEIVASETSRYDGAFAYAGLWTRTDAKAGSWRHLPRAFALPNPVGLRRLAVQTVAPLDVDGDGDLDLFFAVYGSGASRGEHYNTVEAYDGADNHLVMNLGGLEFVEESERRGITGTGYTYVALAFDADHDGDPDLFEGNDFGPNVLWRNDGGQFVADESLGLGGVSAYTMGAALADLEADGRWDLYVSNMSSEEGMRMVPHALEISDAMRSKVDVIARGNALYSEPGTGGAWEDRARRLGVNEGEWAWGCQFFDVDGSGSLELGVTNGFASHRDRALGDWQTYYWRQVLDDARRLERGEMSRDVNADLRFQGSFNGHERDRLFVRADEADSPAASSDRPWVDAAWCLGLDAPHDGRALVPFDPDGDGDLDLVLWTLGGLVYYENLGAPTDWTRIRLEPAAPPRPALGARVEVRSGGVVQRGHVALVEGFQSQVDADVHFGLGTSRTTAPIDSVQIEWPSGRSETIAAAPARRLLVVREGEGLIEAREIPTWSASTGATDPDRSWAVALARIARTPAALGLGAAPLVVRVSDGPLPGAGPFDGPYATAFADVRFLDARARTGSLEDQLIDPTRTILLDLELVAAAIGAASQATVVFDADGDLVRVFRGAANPAAVRAFCELGRTERAVPHLLIEHGRLALDESRFRDALRTFDRALSNRDDLSESDAPGFEGLGRAHVLLGRVDLAEAAYRRSVEVDPDYAIGHINHGAALSQLGRFTEAVAALTEARRVEGDSQRVLGALAEAAAGADAHDLARECAEAWLRSQPDDLSMTILLGKVEARAGNLARAEALFGEALLLAPTNAEASAALRRTRELRGHTNGR